MSRILVTGSSGFVGRHLLPLLGDHDVVPCDIETKEVEGPFDGIIHLAAVSRVRDAEADRIKCLETNILFTAQLLEFKPRWFIFASSCEPSMSIYGYSKRSAEQYIRIRHSKYIILRFTNIYGPDMAKDKLLMKIRADKTLPIEPEALPFEYVHVDEAARQIVAAVREFDKPVFKPYTMKVASGIAHTIEELRHVAASY